MSVEVLKFETQEFEVGTKTDYFVRKEGEPEILEISHQE